MKAEIKDLTGKRGQTPARLSAGSADIITGFSQRMAVVEWKPDAD